MKKLLIIIVGIVLCLNLSAQNKIEKKYSESNILDNTNYHISDEGKIVVNDELKSTKRLKNSSNKALSLKVDSVSLISNQSAASSVRHCFYYSTIGNLKKKIEKNLQTGSLGREIYYYYNSLGLIEREKYFSYNSSQIITDSNEFFYIYNQDSLIIERNMFGVVNNNYDTASAYRFIYDSNNRLIADQQRRWFSSGQQVVNSLKHEYVYSNNRIDTIYEYNGQAVGWLLSICYICSYNNQNKVISIEKKTYGSGVWWPFELKKYSYYSNGLLNEEVSCEWETDMNNSTYNYASQFRTKNIYDNNLNKIIKKIDFNNYFNLYYPAENWEDMYIDSLIVDVGNYVSDLVFQASINSTNRKYFFNNNPLKYVFYGQNINDQFVKRNTFLFHYSNFSVGLSNDVKSLHKVNIFPNPFKSEFHVSCEGIEGTAEIMIYNTIGELVFKKNIASSNETINISHLYKGVYFIKIINNKSIISSSKIIKI